MIQSNSNWKSQTKQIALKLHDQIRIDHAQWHNFKTDRKRRAAELISAALNQIICGGNDDDVIELIEQALLWLKGKVKDPGCPHK